VNPLDKFKTKINGDKLTLSFSDLGVEGNLFDSKQTAYQWSAGTKKHTLADRQTSNRPVLEIDLTDVSLKSGGEPTIIEYKINTLRKGEPEPDKIITVYVALENNKSKVVGLKRH
jgi:hypothetical protein